MVQLQTQRLILRDMLADDLMDLHRLLSDRANMYFLDDIVTDTLEETQKNLTQTMANADGHYFCIRLRENDAYVGQVGYTIRDTTPIGKIVHLGYFILPEHHGKGYMTEAAARALAYAFLEDGCVRVTTGCYADNVPSRRVMEKVGFRREGERLQAQWHDGRLKDRLDYALNREEYLETRPK